MVLAKNEKVSLEQGLLFLCTFKKIAMRNNHNNEERPLAYPRPATTDQQQKNQPEFIDQQPNDFSDKTVSDMPANDNIRKQSNDAGENDKRKEE
jgi:hypothetical protein